MSKCRKHTLEDKTIKLFFFAIAGQCEHQQLFLAGDHTTLALLARSHVPWQRKHEAPLRNSLSYCITLTLSARCTMLTRVIPHVVSETVAQRGPVKPMPSIQEEVRSRLYFFMMIAGVNFPSGRRWDISTAPKWHLDCEGGWKVTSCEREVAIGTPRSQGIAPSISPHFGVIICVSAILPSWASWQHLLGNSLPFWAIFLFAFLLWVRLKVGYHFPYCRPPVSHRLEATGDTPH